MRGGSAVLANRDFPGCKQGSGEERIGTERNAGGAEPVHKGHQGSEERDPKQPKRGKKTRGVGGWDKKESLRMIEKREERF
jgi:hypothetical protein